MKSDETFENNSEKFDATLVKKIADSKAMPPASRESLSPAASRVDRELKRMMGVLPDPPPRPPQVITQADIDAALEQLRQARREELARIEAEKPEPIEVK